AVSCIDPETATDDAISVLGTAKDDGHEVIEPAHIPFELLKVAILTVRRNMVDLGRDDLQVLPDDFAILSGELLPMQEKIIEVGTIPSALWRPLQEVLVSRIVALVDGNRAHLRFMLCSYSDTVPLQ